MISEHFMLNTGNRTNSKKYIYTDRQTDRQTDRATCAYQGVRNVSLTGLCKSYRDSRRCKQILLLSSMD